MGQFADAANPEPALVLGAPPHFTAASETTEPASWFEQYSAGPVPDPELGAANVLEYDTARNNVYSHEQRQK